MSEQGTDVVVAGETCGLSGCEEPVGDGYIVVGMDGEGAVQHHVSINICDTHHAMLIEGVLDDLSVAWNRVVTAEGEVSYQPAWIGPAK